MTIPLDEPRAPQLPVLKRKRIGEKFTGAIVRQTRRDELKDGAQVINPRTGKPRQEVVVTLLTVDSTAEAGIGGGDHVPNPGELVRMILKRGGYGAWIEAGRAHGQLNVGDIVEHVTDTAQAYNPDGSKHGPTLTTQAELDRVPRSQSVGVYGTLTIRKPTADEAKWVTAAEAAYYETAPRIAVDPVDDEETPF